MARRVFISFDYDHDKALKDLLVGQARNPGSPFEIADWSVKAPLAGDWKAQVRMTLRRVDQVAVICGEHTSSATGVAAELAMAREEGVSFFLLKGYSNRSCEKPRGATSADKMYSWTWDNLKALVGGAR